MPAGTASQRLLFTSDVQSHSHPAEEQKGENSGWAQIRRRGVAVPKSYDALVEGEDRIRADLVAWMRDRGVSLVDALPALAAAARQGEPLFPQNADGHFLAPGYAVIARLVAEAVAAAAVADGVSRLT